MSDQQAKAADFLRKAAEALDSQSQADNITNSLPVPVPPVRAAPTSISATVRNLFAPYKLFDTHGCTKRKAKSTPVSYWTHRFCCLANSNQNTAPTREEKHSLFEGGLGEKKITFLKGTSPECFREKLEESYPRLAGCGGFELLRSSYGSRVALELLKMPSSGFSSTFLANESNLSQALCYIRPIQKNIDTEPVHTVQESEQLDCETIQERCMQCERMVPLRSLRSHTQTCVNFDDEDEGKESKQRKTETISQDIYCIPARPTFFPTFDKSQCDMRHLFFTDRLSICEKAASCMEYWCEKTRNHMSK